MDFVRKHALLWLIVLGYLGLGLIYANVIPIFEGPDEVAHFEHARFVAEHGALPSEARPGFPDHIQTAGHSPLYYLVGALLISRLDTSAYRPWPRNPYFSYGTDTLGQNVFQHTAQEDFPYQGVSLAVHILRLWSLALGAGTIAATYFLARLVLPLESWLAIGAAAFVAFLPQFIFMSSIVNSDNLVNCMSAVAMIQIVRIGTERDTSTRSFVLLGILLGLAHIAKGSALALIPVAAFAVVLGCRAMSWRLLFKNIAIAAVAFLSIAGWWYARNILLYGDPLALNWRRIAYPDAMRHNPLTFEEMAEFARQVGSSFWARFGWANISLDERVYLGFSIVALLAFFGVCLRVAREPRLPHFPRRGLLLLAADILVVVALLFTFWYGYPVGGDQGRYLFTALPALAIFFVYGLMFYFPLAWRWVPSLAIGAGMFTVAALIPFLVLIPAHKPYTPPPPITLAQIPPEATGTDITFGDAVRVVAYLAPDVAERDAGLIVRVYWQALRDIESDSNVHLRLVASDGTVLWERARRPGRGLSPTDQWQSGMIVPDLFTVRVPANAPPGPATLLIAISERDGEDWTTAQGQTDVVLTTLLIQ